MYEHTLTGNVYTVHVRMTVDSYKDYSRGDHYAGGGEYTVSYGTGEATIRDRTGQAIAVCGLGYGCTDPRGGWLREVSDAVFKRCVEVDGLLSDRQRAYADWLAERWIGGLPGRRRGFRSSGGTSSSGAPTASLTLHATSAAGEQRTCRPPLDGGIPRVPGDLRAAVRCRCMHGIRVRPVVNVRSSSR
jgi:hypothetical protein